MSEELIASPSLLLSPLSLSASVQASSSSKRRRAPRRAAAAVEQRYSFADEEIIEQIRANLQNAAEISEQEEGSSLKAPCGHAYLSRRTNAWHVKHCSRGGETIEIATLHYVVDDDDDDRQESSRSRAAPRKNRNGGRSKSRHKKARSSCPPVELVEALFMAKELRLGLTSTRRSIRGTRQAEERNNRRIRNQTNLVWMSRWGEAIDVSGLLSAVSETSDFRPLLNKVMGSDIWDAENYQGWTIRKNSNIDEENEEVEASLNGGMTNADSTSSSVSVVTAEQEPDMVSNSSPDLGVATEEQEPTERSRSSSVSSSASSPSLAKSILGFVDRGIKFVFTGGSTSTEEEAQVVTTTGTDAPVTAVTDTTRDEGGQDEEKGPAPKERELDNGSLTDVLNSGASNSGNLKHPPLEKLPPAASLPSSGVRDTQLQQATSSSSKSRDIVDEKAKKIDIVSPLLDYTSVSDHTAGEEDLKEGDKHPPSSVTIGANEQDVPQRKSKRSRKGINRFSDIAADGVECKMQHKTQAGEKAPSTVETVPPVRRGTRSRGGISLSMISCKEKPFSGTQDEQPARISARLRARTGVVTQDTNTQAGTITVSIKLKGWTSLELLEAAMSNKGISKKRRWSESEAGSTEIENEASDDESTVGTPFFLSTTNRLSSFALASEYSEISCKRYETCFALKPFIDDIDATDAVNSMWYELEELDSKHPLNEEFDEDFASEQQLRNRTARIMQGRRSQEKSIRHKEKEQAELLANRLLQLANRKRAPPTIEELEWQQIVDRPLLFQGASTRRSKTISGRDTCPCTRGIATRGGNKEEEEQVPSCRLCSNPDECETTEPIPVKNMMPLMRQIDVDAPEFLHRDYADDPSGDKEDAKGPKVSPAATRGSKRTKFDPKKRKETMGKLFEVKASMDFVEQYNAGLLQEIKK